MTSIHITLPDHLAELIEARISAGPYRDASEYLQELLLADERRRAEQKLVAMLREGKESGDPIPVTVHYWEEKLRRVSGEDPR